MSAAALMKVLGLGARSFVGPAGRRKNIAARRALRSFGGALRFSVCGIYVVCSIAGLVWEGCLWC